MGTWKKRRLEFFFFSWSIDNIFFAEEKRICTQFSWEILNTFSVFLYVVYEHWTCPQKRIRCISISREKSGDQIYRKPVKNFFARTFILVPSLVHCSSKHPTIIIPWHFLWTTILKQCYNSATEQQCQNWITLIFYQKKIFFRFFLHNLSQVAQETDRTMQLAFNKASK